MDSWVRKIHWRKDRLPTPVFLSFPCGSAGEESAHNVGDLGSMPGLEKIPWRRKSYPHQYSNLDSMDYTVHGVAESDTAEQFLHTHTLPLVHDYWKKHRFYYMELCWQSDVSAF